MNNTSPEVYDTSTGDWEIIPSGELEEDSRDQLNEFRQSLGRAVTKEVGVIGGEVLELEQFEDPASPDKPLNEIAAAKIRDRLKTSCNHFFTSEEYAWLGESAFDRFDVLRSAKAETSAHGVFFGIISSSADQQFIPVAIKPFKKNPSKVCLDWLNNNLIALSGRRHFPPVGFITDSGRAYSLTKIERGVETFDNTDWRHTLIDPEDPNFRVQREMLADLGRSLADLHEARIFHNDPQLKNAAIDVAVDTFYTDWESAQIFGRYATPKVLIKKATDDLKALYRSVAAPESMHGVQLLSPFETRLKWAYFNKFILTPYLEARFETDASDKNLHLLGNIEEQIKEHILKNFTVGSLKKFTAKSPS